MPGKRRVAPVRLSRRQRLGVAVAAVLLLYLGVGMWAAFGRRPDAVSLAPPQPTVPGGLDESARPAPVFPSIPGFDPVSPTPPGGSPPGEPDESGGSEPGEDDGGHGAGDRDGPDHQAPPPAESSPPVELFTSRYTVTENDSRTFHARVFLTNRGQTTRDWSVRISFAPADQVSVGRTLGALRRSSGNTFVFSGFRARPGQTEIFGFAATKGVSSAVRPTGCDVDGRACDIRVD
jgi:hypothetical protein